jgi:hypothetical protein
MGAEIIRKAITIGSVRRMRIANRLLLTGATLSVFAAALAGCSQTVDVGPGRMLRLALSEYRVTPQSVLAEPGQLTLVVANDGRLTHNLAITRGGKVISQTPPIPPGQSMELIVYLGRGSYVMTSTLFSDQVLGEYGTLNVGS